jgi:DNA-binding response OmpR family regulator
MSARPALILVIEDDEVILDAICNGLRAEGHDVACVNTVAQATEAIALRRPDAIVFDWLLADERGDVVLDVIVDDDDGPRPFAVMISAAPDAPVTARERGVTLFAKPFDLGELIAAVEGSLAFDRSACDGAGCSRAR